MKGSVEIPIELDSKNFDAQIKETEDKLKDLEFQFESLKKAQPYENQEQDLVKLQSEIEKTTNKLIGLKNKQEELNNQGFTSLNINTKEIGKGMKNIVNTVGKWALAVFGVRSAYNLIRQSVGTLSQYDDKMAKNIEYIRYALAYMVKPIVEWLINATFKLLTYVNYIANAWFGVNLFKNSGIENFEKSIKNSEGSVKAIKKELAGFDEITALQGNSSSGGVSAGAIPSLDLSQIPENVPNWVKWIGDNKDTLLRIAKEFTTLFLIIKGLELVSKLSQISSLLGTSKTGGSGILPKIGLIITSLVVIKESVEEWEKAQKETAKAVENTNKTGLKTAKEWAKEQENINELQRELNNKKQQFNDLQGESNRLTSKITGASTSYNKTLVNNLLIQDQMIQAQIELWRQGKLTEEEAEQLKQTLKEQRTYLNEQETILYNQGVDTTELVKISKNYKSVLQEMGVEFKKNDTFVKATNNSLRDINMFKFDDKIIKIDLDKSILQKLYDNLPDSGLFSFNKSVKNNINKILGLARGGIINSPGYGVPLGYNIRGGEAGAEAVLPLDENTLDNLGRAIAKHSVINATIVNQMNGRTISRELKQVQNEINFMGNV